MVGENFENTLVSTGNRLARLVSPCCSSVCAFVPVFSEKSAIFSAKVAKTRFLAFLSTFLGTSASAQSISHSSCKNE